MSARSLKLGVLAILVGAAFVSCGEKGSPNGPTPVCTITIAPASQSFGAEGGPATVAVTAPATCAWTAASSADWVTVTAGKTGTGPGSVTYAVEANASTASRSGTLTIGGQSHTVNQQGRAPTVCSYELSPVSAEYSKDAATGTFAVSAAADCGWAATSNASWLVVTSGSQGAGNGTVSYAVARNVDPTERTATIAVSNRTFTVRQSGDIGDCQYSVAPVTASTCMAGGSVTARVTTQAGCSWTVAPNGSGLGVPSGPSGTGPGAITITYSDNYDAPRDGVVMVRWPTPTAGQNIHVGQAGCRYAVTRDAFTFTAAAGTGTFDVFQQSDPTECGGPLQDRCVWTAASDVAWITVTSGMPRSGDNPVSFSVAANLGAASRVGRITVRDKVVLITQGGK
jgi:hypothetical protein